MAKNNKTALIILGVIMVAVLAGLFVTVPGRNNAPLVSNEIQPSAGGTEGAPGGNNATGDSIGTGTTPFAPPATTDTMAQATTTTPPTDITTTGTPDTSATAPVTAYTTEESCETAHQQTCEYIACDTTGATATGTCGDGSISGWKPVTAVTPGTTTNPDTIDTEPSETTP